MNATIFNRITAEEGWTESTQIAILLQYIENQGALDAFHDFLEGQRADETDDFDPAPADSYMWNLADHLQHPALVHDTGFQEFCANVFDTMTIDYAAARWRERENAP